MSLVVVGSVAFDSIATKRATRPRVLGGSASHFSVAASFFAPVKLVAVVGEDFEAAHLDFFRSRNIALDGLEQKKGKTFFWSGRYSDDFAHRTSLQTDLNVFADFSPQLPPPWRQSEFLFLGNIHPALQLDVLGQMQRPRLVGMDTMNFWIEGEPQALKQVLQRVDVLFINDEEARQLAEEHNLPRAARAIRQMGPRSVVIKRGDSGALLFHEGGVFAAPAYPLEEVVDPTGAGDCFAGGFMGYLVRSGELSPKAVRAAMFYGSVLASYCVEDFSLDRLRRLEMGEVESRYRAFRDLTHFEDVVL